MGATATTASGFVVGAAAFLDRAKNDYEVDVEMTHLMVSADGRVLTAAAIGDPGHGFAREARRCALSKRWSPGLNPRGTPTEAAAVVNVRFGR